MFKEKMHKVDYSSKMGTEVLDFTFIKRWDRGRMRKVAMSYAFLLVLTVFFLISGSSWAVISISNIVDLQKIGNDAGYPLNGEYELTQDIDASDTVNWNGGAGFAPIGTYSYPFTGKFDGKGYKVTGLYIKRSSTYYIGLFGYIDSGSEVKNVGMENAMVSGHLSVGGLVGRNYGGTVSGCYSTGSVSGGGSVGGLAGYNYHGTVSNCYSTGSVSGISDEVGGLVGYNYGGTVSGCYSTGAVSGNEVVGGLAGGNGGTVSGCYSTGSVSGFYYVGGLVGANGGGTVNNSFAMGSVRGYIKYIGGLIGYLESGSVTNTYSTGSVGGSGGNKGGLIGSIATSNNPTVTSSYWDTQTSGMTTSAGGTGKTSAEMRQKATYVGWDFVNIWGIVENRSYPYLLWQGGPLFIFVPDVVGMSQANATSAITGAGLTVGTVSQQCSDTVPAGSVISQSLAGGVQVPPGIAVNLVISTGPCPVTVPEVVGMSQVNADSAITGARLTVGTISQQCSDTVPAGRVISQRPLGGAQVPPGSAVNLVISTGPCQVTVPDVVGMSQVNAESAITGAGLTVGTISQQCSNTVPAGSVISQSPAGGVQILPGSSVDLVISTGICPIYIDDIEELQKIGNDPAYPLNGEYELTQDIDASDTVNWNGGAGFAPIGTFTGKFDGNGHKIMGLYINRPGIGYIGLFSKIGSGSEVKNIGIEGAMVSGGSYVGGLVGVNYGTVTGCYSTGTVSGGSYVGGLMGWNEGMVSNSFAMGSVTGSYYISIGGLIGYLESGSVTNTYSTGSVGGSGSYKGGLIGYIETSNKPTVTSSYWDIETSGMTTSAGGEGKTTAQMKQQSTFIGWDFTNIWGINEGMSYPYLLWQDRQLFIFVPDVIGMSQVNAESAITGARLTVGTITPQCSNTVPAGSVVSQNPAGGAQMPPGSSVNLVISTGPCPVTVPNVVGMSQVNAESAITGARLTVGTISQQCSDTVSAGSVISQNPAGGVQVLPGSAVDLVISTGPCQEGIQEGEGITEGEGMLEGTPEGTHEGVAEGTHEGVAEGTHEGVVEGTHEGVVEGTHEGVVEGTLEGVVEGTHEGVVEGTHEGVAEGTLEGVVEGTHEGVVEGTHEGVVEGTLEGVVEGTHEGVAEGTHEGIVEGTHEGVVEGTHEGVVEGTHEGEGEGGGTDKGCGCFGGKSTGGDVWLKYFLDFILVGMLMLAMSGMQKERYPSNGSKL